MKDYEIARYFSVQLEIIEALSPDIKRQLEITAQHEMRHQASGDRLRQRQFALSEKAVKALMQWRTRWLEEFENPPTAATGHANELPLWRVAGQLLALQKARYRHASSRPKTRA